MWRTLWPTRAVLFLTLTVALVSCDDSGDTSMLAA